MKQEIMTALAGQHLLHVSVQSLFPGKIRDFVRLLTFCAKLITPLIRRDMKVAPGESRSFGVIFASYQEVMSS
jgi:hypothetical protein